MIKKYKKGQEEKISGRNFPILSRKSGQDQKSKILAANLKRGQEEIAGFAVILVIVSIILLVFLVSYLKNSESESVQNYEVNSFIQAFLQVTTTCEQTSGNLSVQKLISECEKRGICLSGEKSCDILKNTLKNLTNSSWNVGEEYPVKGYELNITANNKEILTLKEGIVTKEYKGSEQDFSKGGDSVYIFFKAYY